jgi:hypothetical protein
MMRPMPRSTRSLAVVALTLLTLLFARPANAAPMWVDRTITTPRLVFAGDVGLGLAHTTFAGQSFTGAGLNLEGAFGVTDSIELGLRTGARFNDDAKALGADAYGRTLFTETYGTNGDTFANPEFRFRWAAYSGRIAEVGLDARIYLPMEQNAHVGFMFGVPLAFHIGDIVRIDTGVYLPVVLGNATSTVISVPGYFWFQVSNRVWLGPMAGLRHQDPGARLRTHDDLLVGFGLGYQVASAVDLKWWLLFPRVNTDNNEPRIWGAGFGVQFRIGE